MLARTLTYRALTRRLPALPPSCGPVRVVASGAGKLTFAARLADALGGAPAPPIDPTHEFVAITPPCS